MKHKQKQTNLWVKTQQKHYLFPSPERLVDDDLWRRGERPLHQRQQRVLALREAAAQTAQREGGTNQHRVTYTTKQHKQGCGEFLQTREEQR